MPPEYIWVNKWDEFQTFQRKRGKPWSPPWIKTYLAQLSDERYLELTDRQRALLHDVRMVFAMTRGRTPCDHRTLSHYRQVRTYYADLVALNHAGFIDLCSGTEVERRRAAFWNRSATEEEETRQESAVDVTPTRDPEQQNVENGKPDFSFSQFIPPTLPNANLLPTATDDDIPF